MRYRFMGNGGECFVYKIWRMPIASKLHAVFHVTEFNNGLSVIFALIEWFFRWIFVNWNLLNTFWLGGYSNIVPEFKNIHLKIFILTMRISEHMPTCMHVLNQSSSTNTWIQSAPNYVLLIRRNMKLTLNDFIEFPHMAIETFYLSIL